MSLSQILGGAFVAAVCLTALAIFLNRVARTWRAQEFRPVPGTWVRAQLVNAPVGESAPSADAFDPTVEGLLVRYLGAYRIAVLTGGQGGEEFECLAAGAFPVPDGEIPPADRSWVITARDSMLWVGGYELWRRGAAYKAAASKDVEGQWLN